MSVQRIRTGRAYCRNTLLFLLLVEAVPLPASGRDRSAEQAVYRAGVRPAEVPRWVCNGGRRVSSHIKSPYEGGLLELHGMAKRVQVLGRLLAALQKPGTTIG